MSETTKPTVTRVDAAIPLSEALRNGADLLRSGRVLIDDVTGLTALLERTAQSIEQNCDAREVRRFAGLMTTRMARKSFEGRQGWRKIPTSHLWAMLKAAVETGDPVNIANYAMMIHHNTEVPPDGREGA